jgi:hypothetical protein
VKSTGAVIADPRCCSSPRNNMGYGVAETILAGVRSRGSPALPALESPRCDDEEFKWATPADDTAEQRAALQQTTRRAGTGRRSRPQAASCWPASRPRRSFGRDASRVRGRGPRERRRRAAHLVRRGLQKARCRASMRSRTSVRASE